MIKEKTSRSGIFDLHHSSRSLQQKLNGFLCVRGFWGWPVFDVRTEYAHRCGYVWNL